MEREKSLVSRQSGGQLQVVASDYFKPWVLWGALETYRGKDFHYPAIGGWIKRSLMNSEQAA